MGVARVRGQTGKQNAHRQCASHLVQMEGNASERGERGLFTSTSDVGKVPQGQGVPDHRVFPPEAGCAFELGHCDCCGFGRVWAAKSVVP